MEYIYEALYFYPSLSVDAYVNGKDLFNQVSRDIACTAGIDYVDIGSGIKASRDYYVDDYYFTKIGSEIVGKNFAVALTEIIEKRYPKAKIA